MRRMRRRRRKRAGCGPLPAEQVASAQSHEVDLAGASGPNGGEEHLKRREMEILLQGTVALVFRCSLNLNTGKCEWKHQPVIHLNSNDTLLKNLIIDYVMI